MRRKFLYEYAIIRIVPRVEREEFFNAGLILFSKEGRYIKVCTFLDKKKLEVFGGPCEEEIIREYLDAFERTGMGEAGCGSIAGLDIAERFRWLTAVRSTVIQTSRPHPGYSQNLDQTFERLFNELVI